jgi:UDP-glucose 4-epimerase
VDILVTYGIGSHTLIELLMTKDHSIFVVNNLSNSNSEALRRE